METTHTQQDDVIEIDLREIFGILLQNLWLILAVGITAGLGAFLISKFVIAPTYESTTKIYILNKQDNTSVTYSDVQLGTQLTKDYAQLITSRYVLEEVVQELGLNTTYEKMQDKVEVTTPTDTRILAITVSDPDPVAAMHVANTIRDVASAHIENVMAIEAVNIVETANLPDKKASPSCMKWTLIGGMLGCLIVAAIVLLRFLLDDTICTTEDVEKYLGLSTLAIIPKIEEETTGRRKKTRGRKPAI